VHVLGLKILYVSIEISHGLERFAVHASVLEDIGKVGWVVKSSAQVRPN
jgi:glycyl-tRNA synthetase alpha subunit